MKRPVLFRSLAISLLGLATACSPVSNACDFDDFQGASCVAIMLTGNVGSKIDSVFVSYEIVSESAMLFTTRREFSNHEAASLPIEVPVAITFNDPFDSPLVKVLVFGLLGENVVGSTSFDMRPARVGKTAVTAPLFSPEGNSCFDGIQNSWESDLDCGFDGIDDTRSGYKGVQGILDRCIPCQSGKKCFAHEYCLSIVCNNNGLCD